MRGKSNNERGEEAAKAARRAEGQMESEGNKWKRHRNRGGVRSK